MSFKVIGIGDNVVDKYVHKSTMYPGGNALNFAAYAAKLGTPAAFIGVFGNDFPAQHIQWALDQLSVDHSRCRHLEGENGYACIDIKDGDRVFLFSNRGGVAKTCPLIFDEAEMEYIKGFSLIHTSINSYLGTKLADLKALGVPISFDFSNKITPWYLANVCPHIDFAIVSCGGLTEEDTDKLITKVHKMGTPYIIATKGGEGSIFSDNGTKYHHKADLIEAIDTLGAGDSFLTAFLIHFLSDPQGEDRGVFIEDCMKAASRFAAETCLLEGAFGFGTAMTE